MKAHLTRRYLFSASHRLHSPDMSEQENLATYGKCNNPHGHGHNYVLEVTVSGPVDATTGMVCNLVDLDECVEGEVLARYHLENLNTRKEFVVPVPTTENLCIEIFKIFQRASLPANREGVRWEGRRMNSSKITGNTGR